MTVYHMPWILVLEPFTECAHSVTIRTDTTLDQDCTESNYASMYSVHGRVIVDNMYEFQHNAMTTENCPRSKISGKYHHEIRQFL